MPPRHPTLSQTFGERAEHSSNTPLATYLLRLMHIKRTNLCVSADVSTTAELLRLAEQVGDHICVLKTHADIVDDFTDKTIRALSAVARKKKFVIFEDRKFGDIGNTVQLQYTGGPLSIVQWAPIVNAHLFPGPAIITALAEAAQRSIAQYNTSVCTSISASPAPSFRDRDDSPVASDGEDEGYDDFDANVADQDIIEDDIDDGREDMADLRYLRKQSVVSVSTTISMKSETMSPRPAIRPTNASASLEPDSLDEALEASSDPEARAKQLDDLGPPPFYRALLLLAEMSSRDNMMTPDYTAACVRHARQNRDFVMGFIAQRSLNADPADNFLVMTPGVQLAAGGDALGQQYNTPRAVVADAGCDVIIVGRGILAAPDRAAAAAEYRAQAWQAYEDRVRAGRATATRR